MAETSSQIHPPAVEAGDIRNPSSAELFRRRTASAMTLAISLGLLLVAASLSPDPSGTGTHQKLGLPPCGFQAATGLPCATCGMTTSFAHAANGRLDRSLAAQPAGATLALLTAMIAVTSAVTLITGASLEPLARRLLRPRWLAVGIGWILLIWVVMVWRTISSGATG